MIAVILPADACGTNQKTDEKDMFIYKTQGFERILKHKKTRRVAGLKKFWLSRSVQLQARTDHAVDAAYQHHQTRFEVAVQRHLVHPVQGDVHEAGHAPFHHH